MVIFVTGMIDKEKLFGSLQTMEREELSKKRQALKKPFSKPCPPLLEEVTREVEYHDGNGKLRKLMPYI